MAINKINNYNLKNLLIWAEKLFIKYKLYFGHGSINAWDEAVFIASHLLNINLYENDLQDQQLTKKQVDEFKKIVLLRTKKRVPLAYIIKTAWFAGKKYYIDRRVIIPRSPIAELINNRFAPWLQFKPQKILDLCTGSGCIAIACYHEFSKNNPDLLIDASDVSINALKVAEKNLRLHNILTKKLYCKKLTYGIKESHLKKESHPKKERDVERIKLIQSDLFKNIPKAHYDLIISNPPYVDEGIFNKLPKEFHFEPKLALVSKDHGLDIVMKILQQAEQFLTTRGLLILEVGNMWKKLIKKNPELNFTMAKLKNGGEGILILTKQHLMKKMECSFNL